MNTSYRHRYLISFVGTLFVAWLIFSQAWAPAIISTVFFSAVLINAYLENRKWTIFLNAFPELKVNTHSGLDKMQQKITQLFTLVEQQQGALVSLVNDDFTHTPTGSLAFDKSIETLRSRINNYKKEAESKEWVSKWTLAFNQVYGEKKPLNEFAKSITSLLVKALNMNQAALYLKDDESDVLQLYPAATFAWDRNCFADDELRIQVRDGLVGQCLFERQRIYMTQVPNHFIRITSGLGDANPKAVVLQPLLFKGQIYGIVELASFSELESMHFEFLDTVSESIASELHAMYSLNDTKRLLSESQNLAQEISSREREMSESLTELALAKVEIEKKQHQSDSLLSSLSALLGMLEFDGDHRLCRWNSMAEQFFGDMQMGISFEQIIHQSVGYANKVFNGEMFEDEMQIEDRVDHSERWIQVHFSKMQSDLLGDHLLVFAMDITDKKQKELEHHRLSLVADNTDNAVIITNSKGIIEYVNHGFSKISGYMMEEVIGKKPGQFLQGPLTSKDTISSISRALKDQKSIYTEILNYRKDGTYYWISIAINPVFNKKGEIDRFISVQADITQTKLMALDYTQKLDALSRANLIMEFDLNGIILEANSQFLEHFHFKAENCIGQSIFHFWVPKDNETHVRTSLNEDEPFEFEAQRLNGRGDVVWVKTINYPVFDFKGEKIKYIKFIVDITNEHQLKQISRRKEIELNNYLSAIDRTIAKAEFSPDGILLNANGIFTTITGYHESVAFNDLIPSVETANMIWESLKQGQTFSGEFKIIDNAGKILWLTGTLNPIANEDGHTEKIAMLAQFITDEKERIADLSGFNTTVKSLFPLLEFSDKWECRSSNALFQTLSGMSRAEIRNKPLEFFLSVSSQNNLDALKLQLHECEHLELPLHFLINGQEQTLLCTWIVVKNSLGQVAKYFCMMHPITTVESDTTKLNPNQHERN
jgi:PAS domain S-box-containing protein